MRRRSFSQLPSPLRLEFLFFIREHPCYFNGSYRQRAPPCLLFLSDGVVHEPDILELLYSSWAVF